MTFRNMGWPVISPEIYVQLHCSNILQSDCFCEARFCAQSVTRLENRSVVVRVTPFASVGNFDSS